MSDYLIKDYGEKRRLADPPTLHIANDDDGDFWKEINEAKEKGRLIAVYRIGECVLDWS